MIRAEASTLARQIRTEEITPGRGSRRRTRPSRDIPRRLQSVLAFRTVAERAVRASANQPA